jgi:hypothetical protein
MTSRDIVWYVQRIKDSMGFRIMEGKENITDTVAEMHFFLTEGLVYSCEMTFKDGSVWTGAFITME